MPSLERRSGVIGIDLGLSVTDAVVVDDGGALRHHAFVPTDGRDAPTALRDAIDALTTSGALDGTTVRALSVTGGRSASWRGDDARAVVATVAPDRFADVMAVGEAEAVGRGGLALGALDAALVVSCGTGTAMIAARHGRGPDGADDLRHVSGTPVGGGTLRALGRLLLHVDDARAIAALAEDGDAAAVDTTLADVLGTGLGSLPPDATAVSLGRLSAADAPVPRRADLAASLTTMVSQTIALVAVNAMRANDLPATIVVGRLPSLAPVAAMVRAVYAMYGRRDDLVVPAAGGAATAFGAALAALARRADPRAADARRTAADAA